MIKMAKCIGRPDCDGAPIARGLCHTCYARHRHHGTLGNYPTMRERVKDLRKSISLPLTSPESQYSSAYRERNYAQRTRIDGYLVHPNRIHGRVNTYVSYGCRGPMCRDAQNWYRVTGETELPLARYQSRTSEECVAHVAHTYARQSRERSATA